MALLIAKSVLPSSKSISNTPPSSPPQSPPATHHQASHTSPRSESPIDIDTILDIESVLDAANRFLSSSSPPVEAPTSSPSIFTVAIHHQTPPSSVAASSPTRRRVTFQDTDTPFREPWSDATAPEPVPQRRKGLPKPILKVRSPPEAFDAITKMEDALTALSTGPRENYLAQYIGLQDVMRMVDDCPQIHLLLSRSKKELLRAVARDMEVKSESTQLDLNLARHVIEFLPLLVHQPGFENGVEQECAKILDRSLDILEMQSFNEHSGLSEKARKAQGVQLLNLKRLHLEFWIGQTLTDSLNEKHVRRIAGVLEKYWQKAENAQKAREEDPSNTTESPFEKANSVQARLNVLQKLLYQVPALMTKDSKRLLQRLLEETISRNPEIRRTAVDIGIATASDMGSRKEMAQAMLSIMTNPSKSKDRTYVQRRIVSLKKRLNGKDGDKDLLPDTWVFPLLYMRHPEVKALAWSQLVAYRDILRECFEMKDLDMKLACWETLRRLISAEFADGHNKQRLQVFWQWMENWIPVCFEKVKQDADFKRPVFQSAVYTYFRVLQKAIPSTQHAGDDYSENAWDVCVKKVTTTLDKKGNTRAHKVLACRILAALFEKSPADIPNDSWFDHQDFGPGLSEVQPFNPTWIRSHLTQIMDVVLPFLEYDVTNSEGKDKNDELQTASARMWTALLRAVSKAENNMDFTSSGRKELKKVIANITNLLSSLWKTAVSASSTDSAIPRFFSFLFSAIEELEPGNFAQSHFFSTDGGSCDASSPAQKGQKPQSSCLHLTALMVKTLMSTPKLCENLQTLFSLTELWTRCLDSRNNCAEKLEYLQSLAETVHNVMQREGKAGSSSRQAKLLLTPILRLVAKTFSASGVVVSGSTFDKQPYHHSQRILELSLGCTTPDLESVQNLYSAMVSSIRAQALSLSKTTPVDAASIGDAGIAIVLTVPHAKMLFHLLDARLFGSQSTQNILLDYATMIVKHDKGVTTRLAFKNGRDIFESANERLILKTIEQHYHPFHRTVDKSISLMYGRGQHDARLADLIDKLIDHIKRTAATKRSIITFIQEGVSLLVKDQASKVFTKRALAEKIDALWKFAGDRMVAEVSSEKDTQRWLREHDILLAAGLSSPRFTISTWAREFWHTQLAEAGPPTPEIAKALEQPQILVPEVASAPIPTEASDESDSFGSDDEPVLPEPAQSPNPTSASRLPASKSILLPTNDVHIPSSPPQQPTLLQKSAKKQVPKSLWDASKPSAPEHVPSTPIVAPGNDEENIPSSPIVSSERRRTSVARTPRVQTTIDSARELFVGETIPSSPPAYITPKQVQREAAAQNLEDAITSPAVPSSDGPVSSAGSQISQPAKRGRGRPRKSTSQEVVSQEGDAYAKAYFWRDRFHNHRPHISSLFQDHDLDTGNQVWMRTATKLHAQAAIHCESIEKFLGLPPFETWADDSPPDHWSAELLERLAHLASLAERKGVPGSKIIHQVSEARSKRLEKDGHKKNIIKRITEADFFEVVDELEITGPTSAQPPRKRKRVSEAEITRSQPPKKRNRSTPSQSQENQEAGRYPKRNRLTPYKEPSAVERLIPKASKEKTPKLPGWKGWVSIADSPEPELGPEGEHDEEDEEEEEVSGKRKRGATNETKEDEGENESLPSVKRRRVDTPSTPERNEIRSDPVVNITPGNPSGRNKESADKAQVPEAANARGPQETRTVDKDAQSKASPAAWLKKFKELLMDVPTYIWRPRDQREVAATYSQVWERVLDNTLREEV